MNKEGTKGKWYYFDLSCEGRDAIPDLSGIVSFVNSKYDKVVKKLPITGCSYFLKDMKTLIIEVM